VSIEKWSDAILVVELQDDPAFTDDLNALLDRADKNQNIAVVLNFVAINYINSSNIAKLLKLRKQLLVAKQKMVLCEISNNAWGIFLVTGLDKVFEFADSVATALASVQLAAESPPFTNSEN